MLPSLPALDVRLIGAIDLPESFDLARWRWVIVAAIGWLEVAPLAIYFAILED